MTHSTAQKFVSEDDVSAYERSTAFYYPDKPDFQEFLDTVKTTIARL